MVKLLKIGFCFFFFGKVYDYNFNHRLVYEFTDLKSPKKNRIITYLINEQENSYIASQSNISDDLAEIKFIDQNGVYWKGQLKKADLDKSSTTLRKEQLASYGNPYKYQVDNYDFIALKDTVLNDKVCKQFMFKCTNKERERKKKIGKEIYIIDTSVDMKPLLSFSTAYEVWKLRKNIPNGLIVEKYFINYKNEMIIKEKLKSNENISLQFNISLE